MKIINLFEQLLISLKNIFGSTNLYIKHYIQHKQKLQNRLSILLNIKHGKSDTEFIVISNSIIIKMLYENLVKYIKPQPLKSNSDLELIASDNMLMHQIKIIFQEMCYLLTKYLQHDLEQSLCKTKIYTKGDLINIFNDTYLDGKFAVYALYYWSLFIVTFDHQYLNKANSYLYTAKLEHNQYCRNYENNNHKIQSGSQKALVKAKKWVISEVKTCLNEYGVDYIKNIKNHPKILKNITKIIFYEKDYLGNVKESQLGNQYNNLDTLLNYLNVQRDSKGENIIKKMDINTGNCPVYKTLNNLVKDILSIIYQSNISLSIDEIFSQYQMKSIEKKDSKKK